MAMSAEFLLSVRSFLQRKAQLDIGGLRDEQLERRVQSFLAREVVEEREMFTRLESDATLLDRFLDGLTINVTSLFRNAERWEEVRGILRQCGSAPRIWSAGCSKGAEAYTIAMICRELSIRPTIVATDIDRRVLQVAAEGVFTNLEMKEVDDARRRRFFSEVDGGWRADTALSAGMKFSRQDLLHDALPTPAFDLICCRNVAIYFSREAKDLLHERLASALKPGGFLFIGSTERVDHPTEIGLEGLNPFLYQRSRSAVASGSSHRSVQR